MADYDTSGTIDALDLAPFVQAWQEKDYFYELGPVTGTAPHFISSPDSTFNIEDMRAFVMMWNWYVTNEGNELRQFTSLGSICDISLSPDSIVIPLPGGVMAYELQLRYQPGEITIGSPDNPGDASMTYIDDNRGLFSLLSADLNINHVSLPVHLSGKQSHIRISFRAVGQNGIILNQFTRDLQIATLPKEYALYQNYPNPFNPTTRIEYDLPVASQVSLVIYDILGREVKILEDGLIDAGYHQVIWDGTNEKRDKVGAGVYLYRIEARDFRQVRKMLLLR